MSKDVLCDGKCEIKSEEILSSIRVSNKTDGSIVNSILRSYSGAHENKSNVRSSLEVFESFLGKNGYHIIAKIFEEEVCKYYYIRTLYGTKALIKLETPEDWTSEGKTSKEILNIKENDQLIIVPYSLRANMERCVEEGTCEGKATGVAFLCSDGICIGVKTYDPVVSDNVTHDKTYKFDSKVKYISDIPISVPIISDHRVVVDPRGTMKMIKDMFSMFAEVNMEKILSELVEYEHTISKLYGRIRDIRTILIPKIKTLSSLTEFHSRFIDMYSGIDITTMPYEDQKMYQTNIELEAKLNDVTISLITAGNKVIKNREIHDDESVKIGNIINPTLLANVVSVTAGSDIV
uniref:Uncharacterized protein n=1 Tax=Pithovirus LCDPAC01 TaxID=2506600 RepID=A0A481YNC6_9VIRU|nr:MAG: uncharacterized protein LCDPAC01_00970 [Pithovirus LCDPAC01]